MSEENSTFGPAPSSTSAGEMTFVASGASCETWRFLRWGKWFLLKRLRPELRSDPRQVAALEKEFDLGIRLDHPGIIRYFERGSDAEGPWLIEEFIDGQTLAEYLEEKGPLAEEEIRRLMSELCDAVSYLHEAGIVHADLKPDNILITRQGSHPKLIDLGLASQYSYVPQPGGTPAYSAPEQFSAREGLNVRADVYALGKVLEKMDPGHFRRVVRKATASRPEDRYPTPEALKKALRPRHAVAWVAAALLLAALLAAPFLQQRHDRLHPTPGVVDTLIVKDTLVVRDTVWQIPAKQEPTPPELVRAAIRKEIQRIRAPFYASYDVLTQENYAGVQQRHLATSARARQAADSIVRVWSARYPEYRSDFATIPVEELNRDLGRYQMDVLRMDPQ